MSGDYDLVIRGGLVLDGEGGEGFEADIAVSGRRIAEIGKVSGRGAEEIDARGQIVTPGFVDIHSHYDGQVTWEETTAPSSNHGVTTVLMGNCGVGFAPCRRADRTALVHLMEGVEDVPEAVMIEGIPWNWETFPEYLDVVASRPRDIDVAAQLPHSCLRVYAMGERGLAGESANEDDLKAMRALSYGAMRAGALGFGTSRTIFHRSSDGINIPTKTARESELLAIAGGMADAGHGVVQVVFDPENFHDEFEMLQRIAQRSGRPVMFTLAQLETCPGTWREALEMLGKVNSTGLAMKGQVMGRSTGMLLGLDLSYNPLSLLPAYQELASLPLAQRVAAMRRPDVRERILSDRPKEGQYEVLRFLTAFEMIFPLEEPLDYEPTADMSVAAVAARKGVSPLEAAYDMLLEDDGRAVLVAQATNYVDGNLEAVRTMITDDNVLLGLGDGGAHYGMICDAGFPTFMLAYWTRDRVRGARIPLPHMVRSLTRDNAVAIGLNDRGLLRPGYKADINVIDMNRLKLGLPRVSYDLPAGGRRITQGAEGYTATIVSGVVAQRGDQATGRLAGELVRGPQADAISS